MLTDASTDGLLPKARQTAAEKRLLKSQALITRRNTDDSAHNATGTPSTAS